MQEDGTEVALAGHDGSKADERNNGTNGTDDETFEYAEGEEALCAYGSSFYCAKVLQRRTDGTDREYCIHYCGWGDSYDEWVSESLLKKNTPENVKIFCPAKKGKKLGKKGRSDQLTRRRASPASTVRIQDDDNGAEPTADSALDPSPQPAASSGRSSPTGPHDGQTAAAPQALGSAPAPETGTKHPLVPGFGAAVDETTKRRRSDGGLDEQPISPPQGQNPEAPTTRSNSDAQDPSQGRSNGSPPIPTEALFESTPVDSFVALPLSLRRRLWRDSVAISQQHQLVPLPASPSVTRILDVYTKFSLSRSPLPATPPPTPPTLATTMSAANFCTGLREFFNRNLRSGLLHEFEFPQFEEYFPPADPNEPPRTQPAVADIYGAVHLLRLILQLPHIMKDHKLLETPARTEIFVARLNDFIRFLEKGASVLFPPDFDDASPDYLKRARIEPPAETTCYVTNCMHIFCTACGDQISKNGQCPGCERPLSHPNDVQVVELCPSEESRKMSLTGLEPEMVFKIAESGFQFYSTQKQNEVAYFVHLQRRQQAKVQQQEKVFVERLEELKRAIHIMNQQIRSLRDEIEQGRREYKTLQDLYIEKSRKKAELEELYDSVKHKIDQMAHRAVGAGARRQGGSLSRG
ncbi:putative nuA4 complex subunit EAF3 [Paratrimastix pyriformis]|uniref:NuA4 complex subunit EAF3 n=1 Tax=Paratrimastix pyriformis TaxID=342808 RepID=A0ABQ8UUK8_9EUKA|nr:putative nuA4 complex subunit EAF3 [Paratrimastix pyriformis]